MKRSFIAGWFALAFLSVGAASAQEVVQELLARMPAQTAQQHAEIASRLDALTADHVESLCRMLTDAGGDSDVAPRAALHAAALRASAADGAALRERFASGVAAYLRSDRPRELRCFLVEQLALSGGNRIALDALGHLLGQVEVAEEAGRALVLIGGEGAVAKLRSALASSDARTKLVALSSLVALADAGSAEAFAVAAQGDDAELRAAGLAGLAVIGDGRALPLVQQRIAAGTPRERGQATELLGMLADHAARNWQFTTADQMLREPPLEQLPVHERVARLEGLAGVLKKGAVPHVLDALASDDPELRAGARGIAIRLEGAASALAMAERLPTALPEVRVAIIEVLAARREQGKGIFGPVMAALRDQDERVRVAAIRASLVVSQEVHLDRSLPAMVALLENAGAAELGALESTLSALAGEEVNGILATVQQSAVPAMRVCLIKVLANRGAIEQLDVLRAAAQQTDAAVRIAAIRAIGALADDSEAMNLIELLLRSPSGPERAALEEALAAACGKAATAEERTSGLLATVQAENEEFHGSLVRILGRLGGREAWEVVRAAIEDQRAAIRAAGLDAAATWPDQDAIGELLELARGRDELREHVQLMRSAVRLISADGSKPPAARIALLSEALKAARRPDERRLLLARVGEVPDAAAFEVLKPYLADAEVRPEAVAAGVAIAEGLLPDGWPAARTWLGAIEDAALPEALRERVRSVLSRIEDLAGFVTRWRVAGPFRQTGKNALELMDVAFPPEQGGASVTWKPQPMSDSPGDYWRVDLLASVGADGGRNAAAYLCAKVHSPKAQAARLELGSDDGLKVWHDGVAIHVNNTLRGCERNQDRVNVQLKEGWNTFLLKVTNGGGGWNACMRVRAADGAALPDLRYEPAP